MAFHLEERCAWVRTCTHTVILDRDRDFSRFVADPTGVLARLIRVWSRETSGELGAYVGAVCLGPGGYRRGDVTRLCRRLSDRRSRRRLMAVLRARSAAPPVLPVGLGSVRGADTVAQTQNPTVAEE